MSKKAVRKKAAKKPTSRKKSEPTEEVLTAAQEFEQLRGHHDLLQGLWRSADEDRLHHALLFSGPAGIGKFQAGRCLAAGLFCNTRASSGASEVQGAQGPCGQCGGCKRFVSGNHADYLEIDVFAEGSESLRIHRVVQREREKIPPEDRDKVSAERFLALKAMESGWRVVLVREMERANEATQNALLKMLEEPEEHVLWILECSRPTALLETVHSRCLDVPLEPLSAEDTTELLQARGWDPARAELFARWSRGSVGEALRLDRQGAEPARQLLAQVIQGSRGPLEVSRELWELEGEFGGKTPRAQARERARAVIDLAHDLAREVTLRRATGGDHLGAHPDLTDLGKTRKASLEQSSASWNALGELQEARRCVEANVAPEAGLERALLALARL